MKTNCRAKFTSILASLLSLVIVAGMASAQDVESTELTKSGSLESTGTSSDKPDLFCDDVWDVACDYCHRHPTGPYSGDFAELCNVYYCTEIILRAKGCTSFADDQRQNLQDILEHRGFCVINS